MLPLPALDSFNRQKPAAGRLLNMIADGTVGANADQSLARLEGSVARHAEPRVNEAVRIEIELEIGVNRLKRQAVDSPRRIKIGGAHRHGPTTERRESVSFADHGKKLSDEIDVERSIDGDETAIGIERRKVITMPVASTPAAQWPSVASKSIDRTGFRVAARFAD